jgi:hypothetical protein
MSVQDHSLQGRTSGKSGHVRYAAAGSKFRALTALRSAIAD